MNRRKREQAERDRTRKAALAALAKLSRRLADEMKQRIASIPDDVWKAAEENDKVRNISASP